MNNFFYNNFDYTLFKKAFKETKGEPVIINILSSDSSLTDKKKKQNKWLEKIIATNLNHLHLESFLDLEGSKHHLLI